MARIADENQLAAYVREARAARAPFEIVAGGTRRGAGKPMGDLPMLDVGGLSGIIDYQPEELIVTLRPGTTLDELTSVLTAKNQCLGFDPADWAFFSSAASPGRALATIGGAISCDASGPGRLRHGPPRDSLLGYRGVNGFGDVFRAGAKVVKNVTGFDLPKLVCGAFGTLVVLSELTLRVYPRPAARATLILRDRDPAAGFALLRKVWQGALEPSGLAYVPSGSASLLPDLGDIGQGAALIRFEAAATPLAEKLAAVRRQLGGAEEIGNGDALFAALGEGRLFCGSDLDVWRLILPPAQAAGVAAALDTSLWVGDWAGSLLWVGARAEDGPRLRRLAQDAGGHAQLLRAPAERRAALGLWAPQPPALAALSRAVKAAFDPLELFNPGRL